MRAARWTTPSLRLRSVVTRTSQLPAPFEPNPTLLRPPLPSQCPTESRGGGFCPILYQYAARQHPPSRWLVTVLALMAACILTKQQVAVITATRCSSVSADIFEPCATSRPDFEDCAKRNLQTAVTNFSAGRSKDKC